ncbi:MAG TPA: guanylate kinase [Nitrospinota bacterium]|nr:guanylate kinase [Nitrospinota bacterium]
MAKKGVFFILSAPSGSGKTTLCKRAVEEIEGLKHSVSYTTRMPRPRERDKIDYYFISEKEFQKKIKRGEFIEWAKVHNNYYGTSIKIIKENIDKGIDLILDIDVQGSEQLRKQLKDRDAIFIFILPPSLGTLRARLKERASDSEGEILKRMIDADKELSFYDKYDYILVNRDLDDATHQLKSIIIAERLKTRRFIFPSDFF